MSEGLTHLRAELQREEPGGGAREQAQAHMCTSQTGVTTAIGVWRSQVGVTTAIGVWRGQVGVTTAIGVWRGQVGVTMVIDTAWKFSKALLKGVISCLPDKVLQSSVVGVLWGGVTAVTRRVVSCH
ncbi:hypothetical protein JZ751_019932, partial [Albula glossodonta]